MVFYCPVCTLASLEIHETLALPADSRSDEIALQIVICAHCGFKGLAVYEESRRGSLDSEAWDHAAFRLDPVIVAEIQNAIRGCPLPSDPRCACRAHRRFSVAAPGGRWSGLDGYSLGEPFAMRLQSTG